jgi:hypothetical protein
LEAEWHWDNYFSKYFGLWGLGWRSGSGAALLVGRSRDRFPVVSLDFSVTYSYHGPGVNSAPSENEFQEYFLGVEVAGADNLTTFMCLMSWKSGSLNLLEPSGPHRACYGTLYLFTLVFTLSLSYDKCSIPTHLSLMLYD